ncbi:hypothetical protein AB2L27_10920 [Kineococcus sp. LSe6-4]|uniref:Uncharacterized protein n=1 Tax=Kineococcus halophytocola TaxID=3234027 RepID=A0ABV4H124_9ACTN
MLLMATLPGCSGQETGEITVETKLHLCREQQCRDLPAAGAEVIFYSGGDQVATATLNDAGRVTRTFDTGTYAVDVSMPELGLHITQDETPPASLGAGEGLTFALAFPGVLHLQPDPS